MKCNMMKTSKNIFTLVEDQLFASVCAVFEKNSKTLIKETQIYQENLSNFVVYLKEYLKNFQTKLDERHALSQDLAKQRSSLADRKIKKLSGDS